MSVTRRDVIIGQAFGLGSALAYGISAVFIRQAIGLSSPLVGAAVALLAGTLGLAIIGTRNLNMTDLAQNSKAIWFLLLSGIGNALGIVAGFFALSVAPVVIVSPLQSIGPLFTLLGAYFFLGNLERITPRLIAGSFMVVAGVILVTLGRNA